MIVLIHFPPSCNEANGSIICAFRGFKALHEFSISDEIKLKYEKNYQLPSKFIGMAIKRQPDEFIFLSLYDKTIRKVSLDGVIGFQTMQFIGIPRHVIFDEEFGILFVEDYLENKQTSIIKLIQISQDHWTEVQMSPFSSRPINVDCWEILGGGRIAIVDFNSQTLFVLYYQYP